MFSYDLHTNGILAFRISVDSAVKTQALLQPAFDTDDQVFVPRCGSVTVTKAYTGF